MFVSEIIPNLWVCDYDVVNSSYFNNRNIGLYIHVYSYQTELNITINMKNKMGYNQELIEINIKDITFEMFNSSNNLIQRQVKRYSEDFADSIHNNIDLIQDTLQNRRGVVIFSKHAIQKGATVAAAYLISKGEVNVNTSIHIIKSKEPLFFKNINNIDNMSDASIISDLSYNNYNGSDRNILYKYTLEYIMKMCD